MTDKANELKCCPFCGSEADIEIRKGGEDFIVRFPVCSFDCRAMVIGKKSSLAGLYRENNYSAKEITREAGLITGRVKTIMPYKSPAYRWYPNDVLASRRQ